jgi:hypothetical protein
MGSPEVWILVSAAILVVVARGIDRWRATVIAPAQKS